MSLSEHKVSEFWLCFVSSTAVKANDSATVLALLAQLGVGFDCASKVVIPYCIPTDDVTKMTQ